MKRFGMALAMVMVVSLVLVAGGWAGVKSFVASYGLDSNACTQASPCRSFGHAVSVTDPGGEVVALDTAGYGSVTITKAMSIIAPDGIYASVTPPSGANGIVINAGASDQVFLVGLTIKGTPGSFNGVKVNTVGALIVNNCFFSGFPENGIYSLAPDSDLVILNSRFSNNNRAVLVANASDLVSVSVNHVGMVYNTVALAIAPTGTGSVSATVTNTLANENGSGFRNVASTTGNSVLTLENCIASGNAYGIYSNNNSTIGFTRLSNCTITGNANGVYQEAGSTGTIATRQNNTVIANTTNSNVTPGTFAAW